jgi:hypothetical protein
MVAHSRNPSTQEVERVDHKFKSSLGCMVSLSLKKDNYKNEIKIKTDTDVKTIR